jgi:serine/threonine-protein kinase PknG
MDPKRKPKPVLESDQFSATVTVLTLFAPAYDPEANMFQVPNLPEFKDYPSLHGWAVRGMALDPLDRFPSMEVWSEQLFWVLREVLAINGKPRPPLISNYFGGDNSFGASALDAKYVPDPRLDESDSAFGELEATIGFEGSDAQRLKTLEQIVAKFPSSREAKFRLAWQQAKSGDFTASSALLKQLGQEDTEDWRNSYYRGLVALLRKDWGAAVDAFKSVRKTLPGEPGAKLALAIARELKGDYDEARANYGLVVISSPEYTYAAFRFAALMLSIGKRVEAIQALRRIPTGSVAHLEAEMQVVRALASNGATLEDLDVAAKALVAIENDQSAPWHLLAAQVLETALDGLRSGTFTASNTTRLLDCALQPRELRLGCELHLMSASQFSATDAEKDAHWARAIELRPLTAV